MKSWLALLLCVGALSSTSPAGAQSLESVLSPGPVIKAHAKTEHECDACHVRFDRAGQDARCQVCHKEVALDLRQQRGLHGRHKPQACRACHTDHRGRDARIVEFDPRTFDHRQTDFELRDKHAQVDCVKCHSAGKRWSAAASECVACHRADDVHKGGLGRQCGDCHNARRWKEVDFDHDRKTRFPLAGAHVPVKCDACHRNGQYKDTPRTCIGCHRKDDTHKGQYGEKCETCHSVKTWKTSTFNHDADTHFLLKGRHRTVKCADCHTGPLYRTRLGKECIDCHRKDDKHKDTLGRDCATCHVERSWKESPGFDHDKTRYPLLGKHARVECKACHKDALYRQTPSQCIACHRKDDKHAGTLGEACADCHVERDWKTLQSRFDHQRTRFPLRNAHAAAKVKCGDCHRDLRSYRNTALECVACHKVHDKHEGTLGARCEQCHGDSNWRVAGFDHARTRFALVGRHVNVVCKSCHETQRYKDAPRDCFSCHRKDDAHKSRFGTRCEECHGARAWTLWEFDHEQRGRWKLDGAHRRTACEQCHRDPAAPPRLAAPLERDCQACHRREDVHDGAFGARCEICHVTDNWKQIRPRRN